MKDAVLHFIRPHVFGFACRNLDIARIKDYVSIAIDSSAALNNPGWVRRMVGGVGPGGNVCDCCNNNPLWLHSCGGRRWRNESCTGNHPGVAVRIGWFIL
jgi:hypothetical protein